MRAAPQRVLVRLLPAVVAGAVLGALETGLVAATRGELFLSLRELARFWGIATCVAISLQLIVASGVSTIAGVLGRIARERYTLAVALTTGLLAAPISAWLYW
ncbi:MAG: hypothetical protein ABW321_09325, partial [Polyangiales bacterium]